jgi:hypothetical protein
MYFKTSPLWISILLAHHLFWSSNLSLPTFVSVMQWGLGRHSQQNQAKPQKHALLTSNFREMRNKSSACPKYCMGHLYRKEFFFVYLRFKLNWVNLIYFMCLNSFYLQPLSMAQRYGTCVSPREQKALASFKYTGEDNWTRHWTWTTAGWCAFLFCLFLATLSRPWRSVKYQARLTSGLSNSTKQWQKGLFTLFSPCWTHLLAGPG